MSARARDLVLDSLVPHTCSGFCGYHPSGQNPLHLGTFELDSDVFIRATKLTPRRYNGAPLAPD